jgi:hypothetical protein
VRIADDVGDVGDVVYADEAGGVGISAAVMDVMV